MQIFSGILQEHKAKGESVFSGADAFKLYDTYGFPVDMTAEMLADEGMSVNMDEFKTLMEEQRVRAREARKALGDLGWEGIDFGLDATPTEFTGYDKLSDTATVLAIVNGDELAGEISEGCEGIIVLDKTPFYAEMGGQLADRGEIGFSLEDIENGQFTRFIVNNVKKDKGNKYLHYGVVESGSISVGEEVVANVDPERRRAISRAHSATHLLHAALRKVLGDHVHQAGSLVDVDELRFDFTHFSALSGKEIAAVEDAVNDAILEGMDISVREMSLEAAKESGATALFGEKYGDVVRVVKMGDFSTELCGGTHLDNTAKVGMFHITGEYSVASGVRRIEAVTGRRYLEMAKHSYLTVARAAESLKAKPSELLAKAEGFVSEVKSLRQKVDKMKDKMLASDVERFLFAAKKIGDFHVLTATRTDLDANDLRKIGDFLRDRDPKIVAVLATATESKVTFAACCGKDAVAAGIKAGDIVRAVSAVTGGKGGGKPDSAMGGGTEVLKMDNALAIVDDLVAEKLGI